MLNKKQATICITRADSIIKNSGTFKIGKTGQLLESRFNSEYRTHFDNIKKLYSSKNEQLINELESTLNSHYFRHPKNSNLKEGSAGDMTDSNNNYLLYIVFTPKKNILQKIVEKILKD